MTNHKPAESTPLPWDGGDLAIYTNDGEICIASVDPASFAEQQGWDIQEQNARYLTHAANAYPKLVELVREARNLAYTSEHNTRVARLDAILRELGEAE